MARRDDGIALILIAESPKQVIKLVIHLGNPGQYKLLDIVVEGVSMAITLRHEYGAVVKTDGVDGLIAIMREKSAELATQ